MDVQYAVALAWHFAGCQHALCSCKPVMRHSFTFCLLLKGSMS